MPALSSALKKLVPRVLRGKRAVENAPPFSASLISTPVGFPLRRNDKSQTGKARPQVHARRGPTFRIPSLSRHRRSQPSASPPLAPGPTPPPLFGLAVTSSVRSTTGSDYGPSPDPDKEAAQSVSASERQRASLKRKFNAILSRNVVLDGSPKAAEPTVTPRPVPPLVPDTPPGFPIPATPAPRDASLPWPPRCTAATIRPPVRNAPRPFFLGEAPTIHNHASISSIQRIFSPDLEVEKVGAGSYGKVYKVTSRSKNSTTVRAVKVVDLAKAEAACALPLCTQEINILTDLHRVQRQYSKGTEDDEDDRDHRGLKHIVKLSHHENFVGICGAQYLYIVMEHYPMSLAAFSQKLTLDELALRFIISQVTIGLNYLHSMSIIHMDLKPDNILVSAKGNCVISDFGGCFYDPDTTGRPWSGAHTAGYVAPEAISMPEYSRRISPKSDFFSLGVSIYDLVVIHDTFDSRLTHLQMRLEPTEMERLMEVFGCPDQIIFMVKCMCKHNFKTRWGGRRVLDYLARNYDPLPSESPLLDYFPHQNEKVNIRSHERAVAPRFFDRFAIRKMLGHRLHWTEQINPDYII